MAPITSLSSRNSLWASCTSPLTWELDLLSPDFEFLYRDKDTAQFHREECQGAAVDMEGYTAGQGRAPLPKQKLFCGNCQAFLQKQSLHHFTRTHFFFFSSLGTGLVNNESISVPIFHILLKSLGTALVAQWLRIHLPMQGTRVRALVREDPTFCGATKPVHHNYWACALEPTSHNYWARVPQLLKPMHLEALLCNKKSHHSEKPTHCNEE